MKKELNTIKSTGKMIILILVAVVQLFPFFWLILFSLKSNTEIFDPEKILSLPEVWHFENYSMALQGGEHRTLLFQFCSVFGSHGRGFRTPCCDGCLRTYQNGVETERSRGCNIHSWNYDACSGNAFAVIPGVRCNWAAQRVSWTDDPLHCICDTYEYYGAQ